MKKFALALILTALPLVGCQEKKVDVKGPNGVRVETGGGEGVKVHVPGEADVKVGGGDGVQVDTPDTKVDVDNK